MVFCALDVVRPHMDQFRSWAVLTGLPSREWSKVRGPLRDFVLDELRAWGKIYVRELLKRVVYHWHYIAIELPLADMLE